ncbi:hypothetical protein GOBAR_DD30827 [Gossypium barbadense]|nr:hypothetical protein GOBAR_DD30827 [Gossypium barbadense]
MAVHVDVHTNTSSGATHAETSSLIQEMGVPVYRDFIVNLSRKHQGDVFVSVSIQYNRSSVHNVPFLNGFEIFKLSDESNSLAGSNPFKARKVYKWFVNNRNTLTAVAIKRSNPESRQGINEFQTEITILSKLLHCHLVSLIGCCMEANESILVYSFMARGALADHLYKTKESPLPWKKRRCSSRTALSPHVVREAMYSKEMFGRQGRNRPSVGEILCNLELAWRQELKSSLMEANGTHGMTDVNFTPMIDGQQLFPAGNSEPTPGVEFSEIIVPTGR